MASFCAPCMQPTRNSIAPDQKDAIALDSTMSRRRNKTIALESAISSRRGKISIAPRGCKNAVVHGSHTLLRLSNSMASVPKDIARDPSAPRLLAPDPITPPRKNAIDLEGRRSADDAWYDCEVSVNSSELQSILRVHFHGIEDFEDDNILTANEARSRLRPRSEMLENGLCLQLQEGDVVLASRTIGSGKAPFYDARLQKILRQRHSPRSSCKCNFELVWLDRNMKGDTCKVTASQIRKISQGNIEGLPMLSEWLKSAEKEVNAQPETSDIGSDAEALLEEEIDRITRMAEGIGIVEEFRAEFSAETTTTQRHSSRRRQVSRAKKTLNNIHEEGSERVMASTLAMFKEEIKPITHSPSDTKPRLSPLAARAALAAMVQGVSFGSQFSFDQTSPIIIKLMEEPPFIQPEKSLASTSVPLTANLNDSNMLQGTAILLAMDKPEQLTIKANRRHVRKHKRAEATVQSSTFCRKETPIYKLAELESSMDIHSTAGPTTNNKASVTKTERDAPSADDGKFSGKRSRRSSVPPTVVSDDSKMLQETTNLLAVGKSEQLTIKANRERHVRTCKRAETRARLRRTTVPPTVALDGSNMLQETTDLLAADKPKLITSKANLQHHAGTFKRAEAPMESSTCCKLKTLICKIAEVEPGMEIHSTAGPTTNDIAAVIKTEKDAEDKPTEAKKLRTTVAQLSSLMKQGQVEGAPITQQQVHVDAISVTREPNGGQSGNMTTKEDTIVQGMKEALGKKNLSRTRRTQRSKKMKVSQNSAGKKELSDNEQSTADKILLTSPAKTDAASKLGPCNDGSHSSKPETQKISFDALPARFDLGVSGWLPFRSGHADDGSGMVMELGDLAVDLHLMADLHVDEDSVSMLARRCPGSATKSQAFSCSANDRESKEDMQISGEHLESSSSIGNSQKLAIEQSKGGITCLTKEKRRITTRSASSALTKSHAMQDEKGFESSQQTEEQRRFSFGHRKTVLTCRQICTRSRKA